MWPRSRSRCARSCCRSPRAASRPPVPYPDGGDESFPQYMAALAAMLAAGLPVRCAALNAPGSYDTHEDQPGDLTSGLKLTADTLLAFQRDLEARGLAGRVVTLAWSEFGRRPEENGSDGTDHGAGGVGFVIGSRVNGAMLGEFPGLAPARRRRQPPLHPRLPLGLLLAARAVVRPGRRGDHPGGERLSAPTGDRVRRAGAAVAAVACAAMLGGPAAASSPPRPPRHGLGVRPDAVARHHRAGQGDRPVLERRGGPTQPPRQARRRLRQRSRHGEDRAGRPG